MLDLLISFMGNDLVSELKTDVVEYRELDLDANDIYDRISDFSDYIAMGLYLIAIDMGEDDIAYKIKRASEKLNIKKKENFINAVTNNKVNKFFKKYNKADIINLATSMNLYMLTKKEYNKLDNDNKLYYDILNEYLSK